MREMQRSEAERLKQVYTAYRISAHINDAVVALSKRVMSSIRAPFAFVQCVWAAYWLTHCPVVAIYRTDGSFYGSAIRQKPALVQSFSWLTYVFAFFFPLLARVFSHTVHLRAVELVGEGLSSKVYRATYCGLSVALKLPRTLGSVEKEWTLLERRLPRDPVLRSHLPIPRYYGVFDLDGVGVMLSSYNGCSLASMPQPNARKLWCVEQIFASFSLLLTVMILPRHSVNAAVAQLQAAGIQPTDVSMRNTVWDGRQLTIIDFVDDEQT